MRISVFFSFCISLLCIQSLSAQELERRGTFGAHLQNAEDQTGIEIVEVIPNTTASALKIETGDVILTVNGTAYADVGVLVQAVGEWKVNDPISVEVKRGKKVKTFSGMVVGLPLETSPNGKVVYGQVNFDGGMLRSILELPTGVDNPAVIFYLPGIGCGTLEYPYDDGAPTKQLVEGLVKAGYAVYRVDKPGMGDGQGTKDCLEMDYSYEISAFETALKQLKEIPEIDNQNIILYGHSLGSLTAPMIASRNQVKGVICWGGISTSWYEYELKRLRGQKVMLGYDYEEIEIQYRLREPWLHAFFVNQRTPAELLADEKFKELTPLYFRDGSELYYGLHHYSYLHQVNSLNLTEAWKNVNCDVLALHGELDVAAIDEAWAINIANIVNAYHPNKGSWQILPKTTHHYTEIPSLEEMLRLRSEHLLNYEYEVSHFNPKIIEVISTWVAEVVEG